MPGHRGGPQFIPRPPGVKEGGPPPWAALPPDRRHVTIEMVRTALRNSGPPHPSPLEGTGARASAVLAPLYEADGEVFVVLTRRAQHLRSHQGEVSFPGGAVEAGESHREAALRESFEETGMKPTEVEIIGELDHLQTYTSKSYIVPFVGELAARPDLSANPGEVEKILHVSLDELLVPDIFREEQWGLSPLDRPLYFFELAGDTVWGATAFMLHNLLALATRTA